MNRILDFIDGLCADNGSCVLHPADLFDFIINSTGTDLGLEISELRRVMQNELLNKAFILERQAKTSKDYRLIGTIYEAVDNPDKALENYTVSNDSSNTRRLLSKVLTPPEGFNRPLRDDSSLLLGIEFDNEHDMTMDTTNLQNALALIHKEDFGFCFVYINNLLTKIDALIAETLANNLPETHLNILKLRRAQIKSEFISYLVPD